MSAAGPPELPITRRDDVVDDWHGEKVPDPYRWLEDTYATDTAEWVAAQNAVTSEFLAPLASRAEISDQLARVWEHTHYTAPYHHARRWFFTRHDAGTDQPVLRVADDPTGEGTVLIDPNPLSADGTVAISVWNVSLDGGRVVYCLSSAGSDWQTWRVRDVATATDLDDVVEWSKFCGACWLPDASGFFYTSLDAPVEGQEFLATNQGRRLMLHRVGTAQSTDELIFVNDDPHWEPDPWVTADGRWLLIVITRGTDREAIIRVLDLTDPDARIRDLLPEPDNDARVVGSDGAIFYVLTDADAPTKRLVAIDLDDPDPARWREVIPEGPDVIVDVVRAGGRFVAHVLRDASSRLQVWSAGGQHERDVDLPPFVTVTELAADNDLDQLHIGVSSFTDPGSVLACDVTTGGVRVIRNGSIDKDGAQVVVERASARSTDGTEVPMFLVRRAGLEPSGDVPAMLYGYGGFDIPLTPTFNAGWFVWVERGGLLAVANLRGGGEFGKDWYDAGRLAHKQNVFDDFAGCARWLASSGWSRPGRIVINGGSNGGLLVGAVLTQHPELVGAAVPEVGVLDMLRFAKFTIGWAWIGDFGDPDDPEQYRWVRAYSPLHAIRAGAGYPPTLVMTADHDDRVVPGHSFKFAAALQDAQGGPAPVLIRVETAGGHGHGLPVHKQIAARADMLAFCEAVLG
ncbi:MAG TPA: prolyl oligopeptidase family serine peptidase [Mycobacteriales bacterium]|nr:prolyl oligopeptidase family serine peptidase [Mycobacteriales bacterium]